MEWINVKDRLPEDKQRVLTCKNGIIEIHKYDSGRNGWVDERDWFWSMAMVAHWMPLPQPPKDDIRCNFVKKEWRICGGDG